MFNELILNLKPSSSMEYMKKATEFKSRDSEIIDLSGGEPDFDTPLPIREEAKKWLDKGFTHYTIGQGLPELRHRIAQKLKDDNHIDCNMRNILVTPGAKYAIYLAIRALINSGDKVLYFEPGWVSYKSIIEASGGVPVPLRLDSHNEYRISISALENAIRQEVKIIIINYPCNPTGRILTRNEADKIRDFLLLHPELIVISDEVYEQIVFEGKKSISLASYPEIAERVITVNGFSKSYAMTGWRVGYVAASEDIIHTAYKLYQHTITCVSGFIMKAATVAFDCITELEGMCQSYEERRNLFLGGLSNIHGIHCLNPEGAFYAWVKFEIPGFCAEKICDLILTEAKVVGVPGDAYGTDECYVRFSFAANSDDLKKAVERIEKVIAKLEPQ